MKKHHCPACGNETFEEVSVNVTLSFRIKNTGNGLEYDAQTSAEGGWVERIQCESCGHPMKDADGNPITTLEQLSAVPEA